MSIASIITRGYGTYGSIYDLAVRGYGGGVVQIDVNAMTMTCQNFTTGDTTGAGGGGSMFVGFVRKLLHKI